MTAVFPPIIGPGNQAHAWGEAAAVEISSGVLTLTGEGYYSIDVEGGVAATDDLDKITGLQVGDEIVLKAASDARTIVLKNGTFLKIGWDFSLDNQYDTITLICVATDTCALKGNIGDGGS